MGAGAEDSERLARSQNATANVLAEARADIHATVACIDEDWGPV